MSRAQERRSQGDDRQARRKPYERAPYADARAHTAGERWQHDLFDKRQPAASTIPTQKLSIENLHYDVSEDELLDLFERIGPVVKSFIKYDRSGRSTGSATVIYREVHHATRARQEYDGANAKGQPISIAYAVIREVMPIRGAAGASVAVQGGDLLSRMVGGNRSGRDGLASRIGRSNGRDAPPANAPTGPAADRNPSRRPDVRADPRAQAGRLREERPRRDRAPRSTADSLDAELEAFMRASPSDAPESIHPSRSGKEADTEMA